MVITELTDKRRGVQFHSVKIYPNAFRRAHSQGLPGIRVAFHFHLIERNETHLPTATQRRVGKDPLQYRCSGSERLRPAKLESPITETDLRESKPIIQGFGVPNAEEATIFHVLCSRFDLCWVTPLENQLQRIYVALIDPTYREVSAPDNLQ